MRSKLHRFIGASLVALGAVAAPAAAEDYKEVWKTSGFMAPESVSYDPGTKSLFVSNINSPDFSPNGKGYISQISLTGDVIQGHFVDGLNAPKGTDVSNGKLYVATVGELVEIDIKSGKVANRYPAPEATFLNDVALGPGGRAYVTETFQSAIYVLENGKLSKWLTDPQLAGANGIIVDGSDLRVATLGDMSGGFEKMKPSNIKTVNIETKKITDYGSPAPIGGLDGIEKMDQGFMVTDNSGGRLVQVKPDGSTTVLAMSGAGSADLEYVPDQQLVVIPNLQTGAVVGYKAGM